MRKWLYLVFAALILAALVPLAGCAGESDVYKIGAVFAVSGANAPLGKPEMQTAQMLEKAINEAGGIRGHDVKIIVYDTESNVDKCVTLTNKLINEDKVLAIVGPTSSGEAVRLAETVVNQAQVPLLACAASDPIVNPIADRQWSFMTPQSTGQAVRVLFDYMREQGITKIGVMTDPLGFGKMGKDALEAEYEAFGLEVVAWEEFENSETANVVPQLNNIQSKGAEAIVCWGTNPGPAIIAKTMVEKGIDLPLFNSHGIANRQFITLAGAGAEDVILPAGRLIVVDQLPDSPQKELLLQYKEDFESEFGAGTANTFGGHAYDAIMMVVDALKNAVTETPEEIDSSSQTLKEVRGKIRDYVESEIVDWNGIGGTFSMSITDHHGLTEDAFVLVRIEDGDWVWMDTWSWSD